MKFGKRLKQQIEQTLPEWRDKFLCYKLLKKLIRLISSGSTAESQFIRLLDAEIHKLNSFFVEQEEDFVIRQKELQERIREALDSRSDMSCIRKQVVDFHGEMVLLENYSSINYTGLAKILKKYDKRTGALLRLPFIEKVLKQPFFTTELVSKLVKECERMMDGIFPEREGAAVAEAADSEEQSIFRSTIAALNTMKEIRKGSSTYGRFSHMERNKGAKLKRNGRCKNRSSIPGRGIPFFFSLTLSNLWRLSLLSVPFLSQQVKHLPYVEGAHLSLDPALRSRLHFPHGSHTDQVIDHSKDLLQSLARRLLPKQH